MALSILLAVLIVPVLMFAVLGLVVFAIVKNRPGIVAAIGGGFLLLMLLGLVALIGVRVSHVPSSQWHVSPSAVQMSYQSAPAVGVEHAARIKIGLFGLLLIPAVPIALWMATRGQGRPRGAASERSGPWGKIVAGAAIAMLGLMGFAALSYVTVRKSTLKYEQATAITETAVINAKAARMEAAQRHMPETDIHTLMDRVDAPRIPLPPSSPAPVAAVPSAVMNVAHRNEADGADVAAEAAAAVAAIAENHESDDEVVLAATKVANVETSTASETSKERNAADEKSVDDPSKEPAPAAAAAQSPAAEAASPAQSARPSWVDKPPKRVGDTAREVIVTDEYASVDECTRATDVYLLFKTYERVMELIGRPVLDTGLPSIAFQNRLVTADGANIISYDGGRTWNWSDDRIAFLKRLGIGVDYVRREVVAKDGTSDAQYFETVQRSFGPMHRLYTQIEFTQSVDKELRRRWEMFEREERLTAVGIGAGGILGLLGFVYGLLKVDTWTKGYYTKRLFLGVPATIIGLVLLLALIVGP